MGLFRPYERKDEPEDRTAPAADQPATRTRRQSMVLGAPPTTTSTKPAGATPVGRTAPARTPRTKGTPPQDPTPEVDAATTEARLTRTRGPQPKTGPTPTRRQAEAARKERLNPSLSPKESRRLAQANAREQRVKAMSTAEAAPEKQLLRDHIDARFNLGEFLLPACLVILALTFLNSVFPQAVWVTTAVMYVFILLVLFDCYVMWRGFRKLLDQRHPGASRKGLLFYGVNRTIQIRRLRLPRPRVKRGEKI